MTEIKIKIICNNIEQTIVAEVDDNYNYTEINNAINEFVLQELGIEVDWKIKE